MGRFHTLMYAKAIDLLLQPAYYDAVVTAVKDNNQAQFTTICTNAGIPNIMINKLWDVAANKSVKAHMEAPGTEAIAAPCW